MEFLGFTFALAMFMFAVVFFSQRKQRELSSPRAFGVFIGGWLAAAVIMFVVHVAFGFAPIDLKYAGLETPLSIMASIAAMNELFMRLSTARADIVA